MSEVNTDFKAACDFFKAQVNKAFVLTYEQKILISALFNQAKHGPFTPDKAPDVGLFDFVGKERRAKWASLGNMSKAEAEDTFVQTLITICPRFAAHLEAVSAVPVFGVGNGDPPESSRLPPPTAHSPPSPAYSDSETKQAKNGSLTLPLSASQEFHIRSALNAQTLTQFQAYAAQQHPDDHAKQLKLISQLQDRHFHQYMEYLAQNHLPKTAEGSPEANHSPQLHEHPNSAEADAVPSTESKASDETVTATGQTECLPQPQASAPAEDAESHPHDSAQLHADCEDGTGAAEEQVNGEADHSPSSSALAPAQMWTHPDIVEFKALLSQDAESVVNVGSGELVTIRVPVVSSGNCIVWEFATDNYDIGFGLFFEWVRPSSSESTDQASWKIIEGSSQPLDTSSPSPDSLSRSQAPCKVVVEEIIPIYRRSSNAEVYCGSHAYPGNGTYLLKFDNTYSLWRSKMLYYRVYSTK